MKRFFRDTGILLAFCGAFYLLTVLVSRLEGDSATDATDFSPVRKRANRLVNNKDWPAAKVEFKKLTEQDPLNGFAWDGYATCLWETRRVAINELHDLAKSNSTQSGYKNVLDQQIADLNDQTREVLLRVKKFARYRYSALLRLAALECDRGNYDEAMDFLEEFVGRGYRTHRGLNWIENFGVGGSSRFVNIPIIGFSGDLSQLSFPTEKESRLHLDPRFWDLVRRERETPADL